MENSLCKVSDVLIVGGGIVGLVLASLLGKAGLRVVVLEELSFEIKEPPDTAFDIRMVAINRASEVLFKQIGVWEKIPTLKKTPYYQMKVWDQVGSGFIQFDAASLGEPNLGHIVEPNTLLFQLYQHLLTLPSVQVLRGASCHRLTPPKALYIYQGQENTQETSVVVGTDGAFSWVREAAGISVWESPYHQTAIIANVETEEPHAFTAWQRFLSTGPLAFLPLAFPHTSSIVWSAETQYARDLMALSDEAFCRALSAAFGFTLGQVTKIGDRKSYPLVARHAKAYVKEKIALVGDAVHTIHPLAGQGLNLGLMDAKVLAEVLLQAKNEGEDIGQLSVLRRYEQRRKRSNFAMLTLMEGFKRLFSNEWLPAALFRNQGLSLVDKMPMVKRFLVRQALGV